MGITQVDPALLDAFDTGAAAAQRRVLSGGTPWEAFAAGIMQCSTVQGVTVERGGDLQHHLNKGCLAARFDGVQCLELHDFTVEGVYNASREGTTRRTVLEFGGSEGPDVLYTSRANIGGHSAQTTAEGYMGADATGIAVSACAHVTARGVSVQHVHSACGSAYGVTFQNGTRSCDVNMRTVQDVRAMGRASTARGVAASALADNAASSSVTTTAAAGVRVVRGCHDVKLCTGNVRLVKGVDAQTSNDVLVHGCVNVHIAYDVL